MGKNNSVPRVGLNRREVLWPRLKLPNILGSSQDTTPNKITRRTFEKQALAGAAGLALPNSLLQAVSPETAKLAQAAKSAAVSVAREPFIDLVTWALGNVDKNYEWYKLFSVGANFYERVPEVVHELNSIKTLMQEQGINPYNVTSKLPTEHPPTIEHCDSCIYCRGNTFLSHYNIFIRPYISHINDEGILEIEKAVREIPDSLFQKGIMQELDTDYRKPVYSEIPQITKDTPISQIKELAIRTLRTMSGESRQARGKIGPLIKEVVKPLNRMVNICHDVVREQGERAVSEARKKLRRDFNIELPHAYGGFVYLDRNDERVLDDWWLLNAQVTRRNKLQNQDRNKLNVKLKRIEIGNKNPITFAIEYALRVADKHSVKQAARLANKQPSKYPHLRLGIIIGVYDLKPEDFYLLNLASEELQRTYPQFSVSFLGSQEKDVETNLLCAPTISEWFVTWGKEFNYGPIITRPKIETPYWLRDRIEGSRYCF